MEKLSIKQLNQLVGYSTEKKNDKDDIWTAINIGMKSNNNYASTYAVEAGHLPDRIKRG
jgi:hypothetical protein